MLLRGGKDPATHHEEYEVRQPAEDESAHDDPELGGGLLLLDQHRGLAAPRPATLLPQPRAPAHGALPGVSKRLVNFSG